MTAWITNHKTRVNRLLDALMAVLAIATMVSIMTGGRFVLHVVLGGLLAVGCAIHVALHWRWIEAVAFSVRAGLPLAVRRNRRAVLLLIVTFSTCVLGGLAALMLKDTHPFTAHVLSHLHGLAGVAWLGLVGYHLALLRKRHAARKALPATDRGTAASQPGEAR